MGIFQYEYFYVYDWLEKTRPSSRLNTQSVVLVGPFFVGRTFYFGSRMMARGGIRFRSK